MSQKVNRLGLLAASLTMAFVFAGCAPASTPAASTSASAANESSAVAGPMDDPIMETENQMSPLDVQIESWIAAMGFQEPVMTPELVAQVRKDFAKIDPMNQIPRALLDHALAYYQLNFARIPVKGYMGVVNFSAYNGQKRFFIIDMNSGGVWAIHVAHGLNSDPKWTGYASSFSNGVGSNQSSLGFYLTAEIYNGKHPRSVRLDGLSATNSNVRRRAVVIHGADYVNDGNGRMGRSSGCLAVSWADHDELVARMAKGALIYAGLAK